MTPEEKRALEARQKLYDLLLERKLFTDTKEEFHSQYAAAPETQRELHDALIKEGIYTKDLSNFQKQFFLDINKDLVLDKTTGTLVPKKKEAGGGVSADGLPIASPQTTNDTNQTVPTINPTDTNLSDGVAPIVPTTEPIAVETNPITDLRVQMEARLQELSTLPSKPIVDSKEPGILTPEYYKKMAMENAPNLTKQAEALFQEKEQNMLLLNERKSKGLITQGEYDRQAKFYEEDFAKKSKMPATQAFEKVAKDEGLGGIEQKKVLAAAELLASPKYTESFSNKDFDALKDVKEEAFNSFKGLVLEQERQNTQALAESGDLANVMAGTTKIELGATTGHEQKVLDNLRAKYGIKPEDAAKLTNEVMLPKLREKGILVPTQEQADAYKKETLAEIRKTYPALTDEEMVAIRTDLLQRAAAMPQQKRVEEKFNKELAVLGLKAPEQMVKEFTQKVDIVNKNYQKTLDGLANGLAGKSKELDIQYKADSDAYNKQATEAAQPLIAAIGAKQKELEGVVAQLEQAVASKQMTPNQAQAILQGKQAEYNQMVDEYNTQREKLKAGYLDLHKAYTGQKTKLQQSVTSQSNKLEEVQKAAIANIEKLKKEYNISTDEAGKMGFTPEYQQKYAALLGQIYQQDELDNKAEKNAQWNKLFFGEQLGISVGKGLLQVAEMSAMGVKYFAPGYDGADFALQDMAHFREMLPEKQIGEFEFNKLLTMDGAEWLLHKGIEQAPLTLGLAGIAGKAFQGAKGILGARFPGLSNFQRNAVASLVGGGSSRVVESNLEAFTTFENSLKEGKSYADAMADASEVRTMNMALMIVDAAQTYSLFSRSSKLTAISNPNYKRLSLAKRGGVFAATIGANVMMEGGEEVYQEYLQAKITNPMLSFVEFAQSPQGKEVFALGGVMGATFAMGGRAMYGRDQIAKINDQINDYFQGYNAEDVNLDDLQGRLTQLTHTVQTLEERGALTQEEANNAKFQLQHQSDVYTQYADGILPFSWNSEQMKEYSAATLEAKINDQKAKDAEKQGKGVVEVEQYKQAAKDAETQAIKVVEMAKKGEDQFHYTIDGTPMSKEDFESAVFNDNNSAAIEAAGADIQTNDPTVNLKLQKYGSVERRGIIESEAYLDGLYPERAATNQQAESFRKQQAVAEEKAATATNPAEQKAAQKLAENLDKIATELEANSAYQPQEINAAKNAITKEIAALKKGEKGTGAILPNVRGRENRIAELQKLQNNLEIYTDVHLKAKEVAHKRLQPQPIGVGKATPTVTPAVTLETAAEVAVTPEVTPTLPVETEVKATETPTSAEIAPVETTPTQPLGNAEELATPHAAHTARIRKFALRNRETHYDAVKDLPEGTIIQRRGRRIVIGKKTVNGKETSIEVTEQKETEKGWEDVGTTKRWEENKMGYKNGYNSIFVNKIGGGELDVFTPKETPAELSPEQVQNEKLNDAKDALKDAKDNLKTVRKTKGHTAKDIAEAEAKIAKAKADLDKLNFPEEAEPTQEPVAVETKETAPTTPEKTIVEPVAEEVKPIEPILPKTEPTKLDDTPINAAEDRKRGFRIRNRIRYNRQSTTIPNKVVGSPAFVRFNYKPTGRVEGNFVLMEADDTQPSHQSGMENPMHFIGEGQPKDRTNLANEETTKAATLKPEDLGHSPNAFYGAPIVNERGEGIQGNGRVGALKLYYNTSSYNDGRYQQWLSENAYQFGFTPEQVAQFKKPILVRMLPATDERAIELGSYTADDLQDKAQRGAEEKGKLRRLSEKEIAEMVEIITKEGEEDDTLNEAIQRNAKELIPFLVSKGILTELEAKEGMTTGRADAVLAGQIENLVKEIFLIGTHTNLTDIFNKLADGKENDIVGNMIRNIPLLLLLPQSIKNGFHNALLGIRDFLNNTTPISKEATKSIKEALMKKGMTAEAAQIQSEKVFYKKRFDSWINQSAMSFGSSQKGSAATLSPIEVEIVKFFTQIAPTLKNVNKTRLAKVYRDFLSNVLSLSNSTAATNQTDIFGGTPATQQNLTDAEVIGTALNQILPVSDKINVQTLNINQQEHEQRELEKQRVQTELETEFAEPQTTPTDVQPTTDAGAATTATTGQETVSENDLNRPDVGGEHETTNSESTAIGDEGKGIEQRFTNATESELETLATENDKAMAEATLPSSVTPELLDMMLQDGAIDTIEHKAANDYLKAVMAGNKPNKVDALLYQAANAKIATWWAAKFAPENSATTKVKEAKERKKREPSTKEPKETTAPKEKTTAEKKAEAAKNLKNLLGDIGIGFGIDPIKAGKIVVAGVKFGYYWAKEKLENKAVTTLNRAEWEKDMKDTFGEKVMSYLGQVEEGSSLLDDIWNYPLPADLDTNTRTLSNMVGEYVKTLMVQEQREITPKEAPKSKQSRPATTKRIGKGKPSLEYVNADKVPDANEYISEGVYGSELDAHQRFAVNLALTNFLDNNNRGFFLADSMGVGKTRQILALAEEYTRRTGKKVLIVTERKSIIDTSFAPDAKAMGIDMSKFEIMTYNQFDDNSKENKGKGDYGLVIYDESQALKNPGKRYQKASAVKSDHVAYSSATPADSIGRVVYYMADLLNRPKSEIMTELGVRVGTKRDSDTWEQDGTVSTADAVAKINQWTQEAFERGAMVRREYPFWGTVVDSNVVTLPRNAEGLYTEEGARMALEYEQITAAYDNQIRSVKPGVYTRIIYEYNSKGEFTGRDEKRIATEGFRKIDPRYKGLTDHQADLMDEQVVRELREQKILMLDKLAETYKLKPVLLDIMADIAKGNAVVLMSQNVNEVEISGLRGDKGRKEIRPSLFMLLKEELNRRGIAFVEMTADTNKTEAIQAFQSGTVSVVIGGIGSMAAGVSLDASKASDKPRVMYIVSPSYSADQFTQALGRVSRRNTVTPALIKIIYASDLESDTNRKGKVERKGSILQVTQGYGISDEFKDQLENDAPITKDTKGREVKESKPYIEVAAKGTYFVVKDSYDIKEQLKKLGAKWNKTANGWMFPISKLDEIKHILQLNDDATRYAKEGNEEKLNEVLNEMEQTENDAYYGGRWDYSSSQEEESSEQGQDNEEQGTKKPHPYAKRQRKYPRISTSPQKSTEKRKKIQEIISEYRKELNVQLSRLPKFKGKMLLGYYAPQSGEVAVKNPEDFNTLIHEIGHYLDDNFHVAPTDGTLDKELEKFWIWGSMPRSKGAAARQAYRRAEGIAEFIRALVVNPMAAQQAAPGVYARYKATVPAKVQDTLERMSVDMRNMVAGDNLELLGSSIAQTTAEAVAESKKGYMERIWNAMVEWYKRPKYSSMNQNGGIAKLNWWNKFARNFATRFAPIEKGVAEMENMIGTYLDNTYEGILDNMQHNGIANTLANFEQQLKDRSIAGAMYDKMLKYYKNPTPENKKGLSAFLPGADPRIIIRLAASVHSKVGDMMENGIHNLASMENAVADYQQLLVDLAGIYTTMGIDKPNKNQTINYIKANYTGKNKTQLIQYLKDKKAYENDLGKSMPRVIDEQTGDIVNIGFLLEPFDKTSDAAMAKDMDATVQYMMAQRVVELTNRGLNNGVILGIGAGLTGGTDLAWAEKVLAEHNTLEVARKEMIEEGARRYRVFADGLLKYMVGKGRMSQDQYNLIKANNEYYVALSRVYNLQATKDDETSSFDIFSKNDKGQMMANPIRAIKGSTREVVNPYNSIFNSIYSIVREADRNEATVAMFDIVRDIMELRKGMYDGATIPIGEIAVKRNYPPNYSGDLAKEQIIVVFNNGEKEFWHIPEQGMYESLAQIGKIAKSNHVLLKPLIAALRLVRNTITKFPTFAINNFARDVWARFINSRTNINPMAGMKSWAQAMEAISPLPISPFAASYKKGASNLAAMGGDQTGIFQEEMDYDKMMLRHMRNAVKPNKKGVRSIIPSVPSVHDALNWYQGVLDKVENKTRVDEYNAAFKHAREVLGYGFNDARTYAAFQARDLMDFAQHGEIMYYINQVILFSGASVQGVLRMVKTMRENPIAFAVKTFIGISLPAMLMLALSRMFGYEDDYDEEPPHMRDMYYSFKTPFTGKMNWIRIPKPFEVGILGSGIERIANYYGLVGKANPYAFDGYLKNMTRAWLPVVGLPVFYRDFNELLFISAIKPLVEVKTNWTTFKDISIVPGWEIDQHVSLREGAARASELGKLASNNPLSRVLFGETDPRYADHLIQGYFGYFGRLAQDVGQAIAGQPLKNSGKVVGVMGEETPAVVDWVAEKTGRFLGVNRYQIQSLNVVDKLAKEYGLTQSFTYKGDIKKYVTELENAKGEKDRYEAFKVLTTKSRELRKRWEEAQTRYENWRVENPAATTDEKKKQLKMFFGL